MKDCYCREHIKQITTVTSYTFFFSKHISESNRNITCETPIIENTIYFVYPNLNQSKTLQELSMKDIEKLFVSTFLGYIRKNQYILQQTFMIKGF